MPDNFLMGVIVIEKGCASACKFANICEFVSKICEFDLEKLIHLYIQNVFSILIVSTKFANQITNVQISIDNLQIV